MSWIAFLGALEIGFLYSLVALGVFLSFRVLNFPDLTVDGSFPLGAAVTATLIVGGINPWTAIATAMVAGALAGLVTAWLHLRFGIQHLLASILTMIALYSINLRIMGQPNLPIFFEPTIFPAFQAFGLAEFELKMLLIFVVVALVVMLLGAFMISEYGLAMRATGSNPRMARSLGIATVQTTYVGMALSNAVVAMGGGLFAQVSGFADITLGTGTIIIGLASVIVGEALFRRRHIVIAMAGCVIGAVIYRLAVALALNVDFLGLTSSDLSLVTAVIVALALILPSSGISLKRLIIAGARL